MDHPLLLLAVAVAVVGALAWPRRPPPPPEAPERQKSVVWMGERVVMRDVVERLNLDAARRRVGVHVHLEFPFSGANNGAAYRFVMRGRGDELTPARASQLFCELLPDDVFVEDDDARGTSVRITREVGCARRTIRFTLALSVGGTSQLITRRDFVGNAERIMHLLRVFEASQTRAALAAVALRVAIDEESGLVDAQAEWEEAQRAAAEARRRYEEVAQRAPTTL